MSSEEASAFMIEMMQKNYEVHSVDAYKIDVFAKRVIKSPAYYWSDHIREEVLEIADKHNAAGVQYD